MTIQCVTAPIVNCTGASWSKICFTVETIRGTFHFIFTRSVLSMTSVPRDFCTIRPVGKRMYSHTHVFLVELHQNTKDRGIVARDLFHCRNNTLDVSLHVSLLSRP